MVRDWAVLEIREDDSREEKRALPVEHGHRRRRRRGGGGGAPRGDRGVFHAARHHVRGRRPQGVVEEGAPSRADAVRRPGGVKMFLINHA